MCEFCHQHGEGRKWYLAAENYSEELYRQSRRRSMADLVHAVAGLSDGRVVPTPTQRFIWRHAPRLVRWIARRYQQDLHWGQVVPIEDVLQIVGMLDWVVRLPCVCRSQIIGDKNARYCFGVGVAPVEEHMRRLFQKSLDSTLSLETLTPEQAREALVDLDQRGAIHSVWTFKSPFIGCICNCDRDCGAYRAQMLDKYQVMFRSEYVARIDPDECGGCRRCMRQCLFGAITFSLAQGRCAVNELACYGCGLCRAACNRQAIRLLPRTTVPAAARLWDL